MARSEFRSHTIATTLPSSSKATKPSNSTTHRYFLFGRSVDSQVANSFVQVPVWKGRSPQSLVGLTATVESGKNAVKIRHRYMLVQEVQAF